MYITDGDVPCKNHDPELWHSKEYSKRTQRAKELCGTCDERLDCLSSTLRFERRDGRVQPSVYGGLTGSERAQLLGKSKPATAA